jgi:hypothetical protein
MENGMIQNAAMPSEEPVDALLRDELARGDAFLESAVPILRHLLAGEHSGAFADEIVARVRGGLGDLAAQLLAAVSATPDPAAPDREAFDDLSAALLHLPGLLGHLHALALEWQLTERLQARLALDPALPPLLQALLASDDEATSGLAMQFLAAQARFAQTQRRMQLPLHELPADLLHGALVALRTVGGDESRLAEAEAALRAHYDESRTRLALAARLVIGMGGGAVAALAVPHAGIALFTTALALASGQDRDVVLLPLGSASGARLALALRAAGLKHEAIETQLLLFYPDAPAGTQWERIGADRAAELLGGTLSAAEFER